MQTARARYQLWISWLAYNLGLLTFDESLFDSADVFAVSPLDASFEGTYDDCSGRLRSARWSRGRNNNLDTVLAGEASFDLRDPTGIFNPDNPLSPLHGKLEDRLHPVKFQATADVEAAAALTVTGGVIFDADRALGVQGDGRTADSSASIFEATTNLCTNGGFETNTTGWTLVSAAIARITSQFKFGAASLEIVTSNAAANEGAYHNFTATAAVYTVSAWVRGAAGGTVRMAVRDNAGGSAQTGTAVTLTGTWQRITLTTTALTAATWRCYVETDVQQAVTFQVDGVQAEQQPLATPYVHTDGATASRAAGRIQAPVTNTDGTEKFTETSGAVLVYARMGYASTIPNSNRRAFEWGSFGANAILLYGTTGSPGTWNAMRHTAAGGSVSVNDTYSAADGVMALIAWTPTKIRLGVDGSSITEAANTDVPVIADTFFDVGSEGGGANILDSDLKFAATFDSGNISDSEWAALYARVREGDPTIAELSALCANANCTAVFPFNTTAYKEHHPNQTDQQFYGWTRRFKWEPEGRKGITRVECVDLFYWLKRVKPIIAATGPTTTGAAIGLVLDAAGLTDPALRDLNVGDNIPDFTADGTKDALTLIGELLQAERGVFYAAGNGTATYRSRLARLSMDSVATITDRMTLLGPGVDFESVYTRVTVKRTQNSYTAVAESDATTIQRLGHVDLPTIETSYLNSNAEADALAAGILAQVETPRPPVYRYRIDNRDAGLQEQLLARELVDRITTSESVGGTSGDYHIDRMEHTLETSGGRRRHTVNWLLSKAGAADALEFDESLFDGSDVFVW